MTFRTSKSNTFDYDADAATYILAVEAADGQRLEYGVRQAINNFVLGCKEDGIWDAIKASCIMAGARTLAGALVPLKGTAPTNIGPFVEADYSRRTGLKGDGSTKYLNSNRPLNGQPLNNAHLSVYVSTAATTGIGLIGNDNTVSNTGESAIYRNDINISMRFQNVVVAGTSTLPSSSTRLVGVNRASSSSVTVRAGGTSESITYASAGTSSSTESIAVFSRDLASASSRSNPRLAFYSIGESLNLEALDNRIRVLMYTLSHNVIYDTDAQAYITAVETADGQPLEVGVKAAIDEFVVGCKKDGIWDAIKASCIMAGARTLSGALVPLKGTAPTNFNFVAADYNRKTGLIGNGSTKALNANRAGNADPQNYAHFAVYRTTAEGTPSSVFGGITDPGTRNAQCYYFYGSWYFSARKGFANDPINGSAVGTTGLLGVNRSSSTSHAYRIAGSTTTSSITSVAPTSEASAVYAVSYNGSIVGHSSVRLGFYSIGESLDLALLDARITTLINNFAAILP